MFTTRGMVEQLVTYGCRISLQAPNHALRSSRPRPRAPLPALLQFDFDVPICKWMNNLICPLIVCGGVEAILVALDANGGFGLLRIAAALLLASAARS